MSRAPGSLRLGGILLKNGFIREAEPESSIEARTATETREAEMEASLVDDGREKVLNGITSYEEVVRVAYQEE
jgi:type II secretory ATPase GspE/PulE/Tfp pilus assembly ATPase PilB-like protein